MDSSSCFAIRQVMHAAMFDGAAREIPERRRPFHILVIDPHRLDETSRWDVTPRERTEMAKVCPSLIRERGTGHGMSAGCQPAHERG
jgi:hypothetical protein